MPVGTEIIGEGEKHRLGIYSKPPIGGRLHHGTLLAQVREWIPAYNDSGDVEGAGASDHKLAVILTPDCDLAQDHTKRKDNLKLSTDLRSILLCPARAAEELRKESSLEMNRKLFELVRTNKAERYQYLAAVPNGVDPSGQCATALIVDFRSYFTVHTAELYRQFREGQLASPLAVLNVPWREHLQQRFANYLGRIGLPLDHFVPESRQESTALPTDA